MAHANLTLFDLPRINGEANRIDPLDLPVHDWYRFVLSFPPHLVREYMKKFGLDDQSLVLDPFCGTGTTIVECKKNGIPAIGIEALPMPHFASMVKTDWEIDAGDLRHHAERIAEKAAANLLENGVHDEPAKNSSDHNGLRVLPSESQRLLLKNSISPLPLHKTLVLLDAIRSDSETKFRNHELLALAKALVTTIGNLRFGPEVGLGTIKQDARVIGSWLNNVEKMAQDLSMVSRHLIKTPVEIHQGDSRNVHLILRSKEVDGVFTSPPYPNEKDYTRTTRLETVLLGFVRNLLELRNLKKNLVRSNTRGVYKEDEDDKWVSEHSEIYRISAEIERRRIEQGKTSGFERLYHRVATLYFGGMAQHLASLRPILRPGALLGYVVGDQASYLRVMIRTGQLIAQIAESLGYRVESIDLFRTRLATATGEQLREEIVVLRWPG